MPQEQVRVPPVGPRGAAGHGRPCPMGGPPSCPLVLGCLPSHKKISVNFEGNPTIFPVVTFLKYKNSKNRELALGILSIGLFDKMHKNDVI